MEEDNKLNKDEILDALSLNDKQREAVLINDAPLLILAGAGSGKTRTIISKIVYDIEVLGIRPYNILAVTFTNKAAEEMRERLKRYIGEERAKKVVIKTFHSFGAMILREWSNEAHINPNFVIYDAEDAKSLLHTKYPDEKIKDLKPIVENIFAAKERGYNVKTYMNYFDSHTDVHEYFKTYDAALRESGNVDLPELILLPTALLSTNVAVRKDIQRRFTHIFVDEYQDTNASQFALLKCLIGDNNIICVVGDDDQSIYGFRGSEVEHILRFQEYFKGSKVVKLEENYRSSGNIIGLASSVISKNKSRHEKRLWTGNDKGGRPGVYYFDDGRREAAFVAKTILKDRDFSSTAVLYRTNSQSVEFEKIFIENNIPYYVIRGNSFYERRDIKDAVALMSFMINPKDSVAFLRVMERPSRGIGEKTLQSILESAEKSFNGNVLEALSFQKLSAKASAERDDLVRALKESHEILKKGNNIEAIHKLLTDSKLYAFYTLEDEKENNVNDSHKMALDNLVEQMGYYSSGEKGVIDLLEQMALVSQQDTKATEGVALSSIHGVKGLEYDRVFITGVEQGLFPSGMSDDVEEERRLMYVAITRARHTLYITSSALRFKFGHPEPTTPSVFIKDMDREYYDLHDERTFSRYSSYDDSGYRGYSNSYSNGYSNSYKGYSNNSSRSRMNDSDLIPSYLKSSFKSNASHREDKSDVLSRLKRASELENNGFKKAPILIKKEVSEEVLKTLPFKKGDRVRKDDVGEGVVINIRPLKERYLMDIRFDSGRESVFPVTTDKVVKI